VPWHDHRGHPEDALPALLRRRLAGAERVDRQAVRAPPGMRAGVDAVGGGGEGGDVLVAWWEPGTRFGYHAKSFGFVLGEIIRRVTWPVSLWGRWLGIR